MMFVWLALYNIAWLVIWPLIKLWCKLSPGKNWHCQRIDVEPGLTPSGKKVIWLHALSLGEVNTAIPLIQELKKYGHDVIVSSTTESGFERAIELLHDTNISIFPMPFDTLWNIKKILKNPIHTIIILETDIWPNLIWTARKNRIPVFLVNARMRQDSFRNYKIMKHLKFNIFSLFTRIFPASESDARYYLQLTEHDRNKVIFLGNLKWDYIAMNKPTLEEIEALRNKTNIPSERPVWIAGSIHKGEEEAIIKAHKKVQKIHKNALLIIAPRKLELTASIIQKCRQHALKYELRSRERSINDEIDVLIVDTFGELLKFYGLGRCAFVGGSMVRFGGHNLFEPATYGIPVCWGPYVFNFLDMAETLKATGTGKEISGFEELVNFVINALSNHFINSQFAEYPCKSAREIIHFMLESSVSSTVRN